MATRCPKCNADNPDTKSFCGDCGTQLGDPKDIPVHTKTIETPFPQFTPGTSLAGRYEIIKELGKGGMGEVYLAEDTNLKRQVAIKVLPKAFSMDKERLARFEREARLLASLNHPNIATIHGLEKSDDQQFLVMELVEGDTLAERIKNDPLPIDDALEVCKQIAEGLELAHEKGIIHRDLKPGNIKITGEGNVKILDFGLAKPYQEEQEAIDLSKSPTLTDRMTQPGVILGTAAYMSPEQARSHPVDKRTDIWAFGCVLYECLTGQLAFPGETFSDTLAHILKGEPGWNQLPANTPQIIRILLHRCMQKDPRKRLHDIADARLEIDEALSGESAPSLKLLEFNSRAWSRKRLRPAVLISVVAGLVIGSIATAIALRTYMRSTHSVPGQIGHFTIDLPPDAPVRIFDQTSVAISPDGTRIVYCALNYQLFIRDLNTLEAKPILGTKSAFGPFFSPDGDWVGYFDYGAGKLMKVFLHGGTPTIICDAPINSRGASWGLDDIIVFNNRADSCLYKVSSLGGVPEAITSLDLDKKEKTHRFPQILPDGDTVLFTIGTTEMTSYDDADIEMVSLKSGKRKHLLDGGSNARYASTGHIVYAHSGSLMAVPFDMKRGEITGDPVRIVEGVITSDNNGPAQFNLCPNGSLIYISGGPEFYYNKLVWIDRNGRKQSLSVDPRSFWNVDFSPDGNQLAVQISGGNEDVWIYEIQRGTLSRLTAGGDNRQPVWTPESNRVTYRKDTGETNDIFWKPADSSAAAEKLLSSEYGININSWSPDGKTLVFSSQGDLWTLPAEGDRNPEPLMKTPFYESSADISPDGRWIAYVSNESGKAEVYVSTFPKLGRRWPISTEGGTRPRWASAGELVYMHGNTWYAVPVKTEPQFIPGKPKSLFENSASTGLSYDITPDGQRFIMIEKGDHSNPPSQLNIVLNWFEELKLTVPTRK